MPVVKNISGEDLEVPLLRRIVRAGEEVEIAAEHVDSDLRLWAHSHWLIDGQPQAVTEPAPVVDVAPEPPAQPETPVTPEVPADPEVTE